jgi:hypothetical protein
VETDSGAVSCQHWKREVPLRAEMAVRLKYVGNEEAEEVFEEEEEDVEEKTRRKEMRRERRIGIMILRKSENFSMWCGVVWLG